MHEHHIKGMLRALRSVPKDRTAAKERLERYWSDKIAIVWTVEDVHRAANEREIALTAEEANQVLRHVFDHHDAQCGIKWEDLTNRIEDCVLGRKMSKREVDRFVHHDIITIQKPTRNRRR